MKLITKIIILLLLISCNNKISKSKIEIAQEYFESQKEFDKSNLNKLLSDNVKVFYGNEIGTDNKESLIKTTGFSYGLNTQNELIKITLTDTNKVELTIKEMDDLTKHFEMDNVIYKYTYEINNDVIQKITLDTIDNPNFNYKQQEITFNKKLNRLMEWIHENHKDKAELMDEYDNDYRAGKILSELIKKRNKNVR
ncbi:hypothetical protein H3Z83_12795 [Tenacibaculum sp. S7007]|uniref:Uncharacterized protein n=1 Tax=Tenacibaculum pelagium TaxID=2759527 RepID=A0A839ASS3_9FLAO|nr:hypothetical protein [Tenacibaculum pelagium]MBA6157388.1 hypothetical protein [Tenacibaculum pelagium]